jgi:hypothetical protein
MDDVGRVAVGQSAPGVVSLFKLSLCLTKHCAIKAYVGVVCRFSFSSPRHYLEVSGQLHAPAALTPMEDPSVHIG